MRVTRLGRTAGFLLPILMVGALTVACSDNNETTGPTINELAGTWDGSSVLLTLNANPSIQRDLVQDLGLTVTLEVLVTERYSFTAALGATPVEVVTGDFNLTGSNRFELTNDDEPGVTWEGTFTLAGDNLSVRLQDVTLLDFDNPPDGENDETLMEADFVRES